MKICIYFLTVLTLLSACSNNNVKTSKEEKTMESSSMINANQVPPVSDFEKLRRNKQSITSKEQGVEEIAKFYFYEINNLAWERLIAVDLANKGLFLNPGDSTIGVAELDEALTEKDIQVVEDIFIKNNVTDWLTDYSYGDKQVLDEMGGEGYNWQLCIQYNDGTAFYKSGKGTSKEEIQPEGYQKFVDELEEFVNSKKLPVPH
ncbi:hypothetical protein [uncultured Vagococcus sp.]|uniref:hypothetical protein n=1 Tax=uncultured Vagococcus sp. TaxID=189676 RepID=UPI0028D7C75F|nr:hypothetical protein [uncultured Vagococcus sp.]